MAEKIGAKKYAVFVTVKGGGVYDGRELRLRLAEAIKNQLNK